MVPTIDSDWLDAACSWAAAPRWHCWAKVFAQHASAMRRDVGRFMVIREEMKVATKTTSPPHQLG